MAGKEYIRPRMISREELERALVEANEQLSQANERLLQQEKERAALFSNLSHDLRAPMAALTGTVALLRERQEIGGEEYRELLDLMGRRLKNISSILDDIFLLGQMENPDLVLNRELIEAEPLLEEFFYSCEADSCFQDRTLRLELEDDLDCYVDVDAEKIVRVLDNLFTNALRYSGVGAEICLSAKKMIGDSCQGQGKIKENGNCDKDGEKPRADATHFLRISVRDTGMGIPPEDLPHVFERSFRGDKSRTPGISGHGLGLAIAKSIVERHGGEIRCESEVGKGSTFIVELPIPFTKPR